MIIVYKPLRYHRTINVPLSLLRWNIIRMNHMLLFYNCSNYKTSKHRVFCCWMFVIFITILNYEKLAGARFWVEMKIFLMNFHFIFKWFYIRLQICMIYSHLNWTYTKKSRACWKLLNTIRKFSLPEH